MFFNKSERNDIIVRYDANTMKIVTTASAGSMKIVKFHKLNTQTEMRVILLLNQVTTV